MTHCKAACSNAATPTCHLQTHFSLPQNRDGAAGEKLPCQEKEVSLQNISVALPLWTLNQVWGTGHWVSVRTAGFIPAKRDMENIALLDLYPVPLPWMKFKSHLSGKNHWQLQYSYSFLNGMLKERFRNPYISAEPGTYTRASPGQNASDHISEGRFLILPTHEVQ